MEGINIRTLVAGKKEKGGEGGASRTMSHSEVMDAVILDLGSPPLTLYSPTEEGYQEFGVRSTSH